MFEAGDAAFFLLLALSAWKVAEVAMRMLRAPVRMPRPGLGAAEVAAQCGRHLRSLEFYNTREGIKLHLRGCRYLKEDEVLEKPTSRRKGSEGKPHEVISRTLCSYCAVKLEDSLRVELESTD